MQFFGTFHSVAMRMLKNTLLQAKAENGEIVHTVENSSMAPEEWTSEFEIYRSGRGTGTGALSDCRI